MAKALQHNSRSNLSKSRATWRLHLRGQDGVQGPLESLSCACLSGLHTDWTWGVYSSPKAVEATQKASSSARWARPFRLASSLHASLTCFRGRWDGQCECVESEAPTQEPRATMKAGWT